MQSVSPNPKFTPSGHPNRRIKPHIVSFLYLHPPKLPDFVEITPNSPHRSHGNHLTLSTSSTTAEYHRLDNKYQTLIFTVVEGRGSNVKIPAGLVSNDTSCLFFKSVLTPVFSLGRVARALGPVPRQNVEQVKSVIYFSEVVLARNT